jgi:hypothetical protein
MDARSLNMWQHHALLNDTPEDDCIVDHLAVLVHNGVRPSQVAELLRLTRQLIESNLAEGQYEMAIAGSLDTVARRLHDIETAGQNQGWTVKDLGRALRDALPVLAEPGAYSMRRVIEASVTVDRIVREVSPETLFSDSVRKEIRATNYGRLLEVYAEHAGALERDAA